MTLKHALPVFVLAASLCGSATAAVRGPDALNGAPRSPSIQAACPVALPWQFNGRIWIRHHCLAAGRLSPVPYHIPSILAAGNKLTLCETGGLSTKLKPCPARR
jgi:hypothetical protein